MAQERDLNLGMKAEARHLFVYGAVRVILSISSALVSARARDDGHRGLTQAKYSRLC